MQSIFGRGIQFSTRNQTKSSSIIRVQKRFGSDLKKNDDKFCGVVVGMYEGGKLTKAGEEINQQSQGKLKRQLEITKSKGKAKETLLFLDLSVGESSTLLAPRVAVVGLGKEEQEAEKLKDSKRFAAALGTRLLKKNGATNIAVEDFDGEAQLSAEGSFLSLFKYSLKTKPQKSTNESKESGEEEEDDKDVQLSLWKGEDDKWSRGKVFAEAQNFARTLGETPANLMTPTLFTQSVINKFEEHGLNDKVKLIVREKTWAESQKMGCFLGVARGSQEPLKFLEIHYQGNPSSTEGPIAYVGKGVTFDSGGISIKPSGGMAEMKADMSGAATVASSLWGIAKLGLKTNVSAFIPLCENMPSGTATKPGDVLFASNGKSVDVDNTDAEGRLILADALHYAHSFNPTTVIDVATLTGAIGISLGHSAFGTFTNSKDLWEEISTASEQTNEPAWRMPYHFPEYHEAIKSDVADLINSTKKRGGGSCTAAAFLSNFVTVPRWAHLDIAGVMTAQKTGYLLNGFNSGIPTRTLIQFAANKQ